MNKAFYLWICSFLLFCNVIPYGFEGQTLVSTPYGKYPISKINKFDWVYATDLKDEVIAKKVLAVTKMYVPQFVRIWIGNSYIDSAEDQLFYIPDTNKWKQARHLTTADIFQSLYIEDLSCPSHIETIYRSACLYDLCIEGYHNFYISQQPFLVHNFPAIGICLTWLFGGGTVTFAGVTVTAGTATGVAAAATAVGIGAGMVLSKNGGNTDEDPLERSDEDKEKKVGGSPQKPDRQKNETTKPEFFKQKKVKENYQYDKATNSHKLKKNGEPIADKKNEHMTWDHTHNDVESFDKNGKHIGSINPDNNKMYKEPVPHRKLDK